MPIPTDEERVGTLVADRYRIESIVGKGGMGVVYEATHTWTGRRVAVKLMKPDYASDATGVRRFLQEARSAAKIEHPHVVSVLDMGADEGGDVFLVLELLTGQPLSRMLDDKKQLSADEALELLLPIIRAVKSAHGAGVLHRDIKPDNIFITDDAEGGRIPKLLDFGMAKIQESNWGNTTASGTLVGTPFYMSPEQAEGDPEVGPAADVWSMGAVFYRCLTGRPPFTGRNPTAILLAITRGEIIPITELAPEVPPAIAAVVERALTPDRAVRYADMPALRAALEAAARESRIALSPTTTGSFEAPKLSGITTPSSISGPPKRRLGAIGAIAAVVVVATALAIGFGGRDGAAANPQTPPRVTRSEQPAEPPAPMGEAAEDVEAEVPETDERVAMVHLESEPSGAEVMLGDESICTTPCDFERAIERDVELRLSYRGRRTRTVTVSPGQIEELRLTLPPTRAASMRIGMRSKMSTPELPPGLF